MCRAAPQPVESDVNTINGTGFVNTINGTGFYLPRASHQPSTPATTYRQLPCRDGHRRYRPVNRSFSSRRFREIQEAAQGELVNSTTTPGSIKQNADGWCRPAQTHSMLNSATASSAAAIASADGATAAAAAQQQQRKSCTPPPASCRPASMATAQCASAIAWPPTGAMSHVYASASPTNSSCSASSLGSVWSPQSCCTSTTAAESACLEAEIRKLSSDGTWDESSAGYDAVNAAAAAAEGCLDAWHTFTSTCCDSLPHWDYEPHTLPSSSIVYDSAGSVAAASEMNWQLTELQQQLPVEFGLAAAAVAAAPPGCEALYYQICSSSAMGTACPVSAPSSGCGGLVRQETPCLQLSPYDGFAGVMNEPGQQQLQLSVAACQPYGSTGTTSISALSDDAALNFELAMVDVAISELRKKLIAGQCMGSIAAVAGAGASSAGPSCTIGQQLNMPGSSAGIAAAAAAAGSEVPMLAVQAALRTAGLCTSTLSPLCGDMQQQQHMLLPQGCHIPVGVPAGYLPPPATAAAAAAAVPACGHPPPVWQPAL